jgi:glycosyltransferase involved in cell wall biosynthesis
LLDPAWYRQSHPDLRETPVNVARHYLDYGAREGRNPSPHFHTTFYLKNNPDVAESGINPLLHFILYGMSEGREPFPLGAQSDPQRSAQIVQNEMNSLLTPMPEDLHATVSISAEEMVEAPRVDIDTSQTSARTRHRRFAILFLSGEPHTPGHSYRVQRYADAAKANGFVAECVPITGLEHILSQLSQYDALVIWRATWSPLIEAAVLQMRELGKKVVFDVDDLMIDPELDRTSVIDGIRTQYLTETDVENLYGLVRRTMLAADVCFCTTQELAFHIRKTYKSTFVLPNGFDQPTHDASRLAAKRWCKERDGLIRLGYAGGSRTHQRDLAVAIDAIARILREEPNCRLVLFRKIDGNGITHNNIDVEEYPSLVGLHQQIEWRQIQPLALLPNEIARFDVNLAPLEIGNVFCEAKSELKFFEAALVDVPTVASPTGPFRRAIEHGKDGFLAVTSNDWYVCIQRLIHDDALREEIVKRAYYKSLALFGPRQRALQFGRVVEQIQGGSNAARGFALEAQLSVRRFQPPKVFPSVVIFERDAGDFAEVAVVVPLYNYESLVCEALDSVLNQTLKRIDLVIVDDCSTDSSLVVATNWAREHHARFNHVIVLQNRSNYGLGLCRNSGIAAADTAYVLLLDADNRLLPKCCEALLETIKRSGAAFAYPTIQQFGDTSVSMSNFAYEAQRFAFGNYIDAMALVSKEAWAMVGGIEHVQYGWEDYDLWCRFAEIGLVGEGCEETLAEYRVHEQSMLRTHTTIAENYKKLHHN